MARGSRELLPGAWVGERYRIAGTLGAGSFSTVYRAFDVESGATCALKVLHMGQHVAEGHALERFKREVLLSQQVVDERCCRIHGFFELQGLAVLTMELLEGWTPAELLARLGSLPLDAALSLCAQAAASVSVLHGRGIVHRDIKAQNMMVARNGRLKVMDLGHSWSATLASLTSPGTLLGTPTHMAPEHIRLGESLPQSDVYALGVFSYHLLGGRLPFQGLNLTDLIVQHISAAPQPLRQLRRELSPAVENLVLRCLGKEPAERPADAGELAGEWQALLGGPPDPAPIREALVGLAGRAAGRASEPALDDLGAWTDSTELPASSSRRGSGL